jgi:hypothetical protein
MGAAASKSAANQAKTATLKNALEKYIAATKNLKNKQNILLKINNKPTGSIRTYRNMIANGVANAVVASRNGLIPETTAAAAVKQATTAVNKLKNLNVFMNKLKAGSTPESEVNYYRKSGRSVANNRKLNAMKRNNGTSNKYTNLFNKINKINTKAALSQLPGAGNVGNSGEIRTARTPNKTNNGKNKYVKLIRNTPNSNWKFVNSTNNSKYLINQTNKNEPVIKNKNTAQGTTSTNYNTRKSNIGNYIWGRAHGGFGGLAINTNYPKIAANTKAKYPGFPRGIKRENLNAYINSKPKSGQQTERAKAILNVLFAPQSSN